MNTTLTFFLRTMPPSVTLAAAKEHDRLIADSLYELVGGARVGRKDVQWVRALKQARLPVNMGGMGLTSAEDIRGAAWVGTWALVTRPIRELHRPFADLDVSTAPGEGFDELREAHTQLVSRHDLTDKCQRSWRTRVVCREVVSPGTAINEAKAEPRFRFYPHGLTPAAELLPLAQFSSTNEFLHQAQRRYTSGVHHANWLDLAKELPTRRFAVAAARRPPKATRSEDARTTNAGERRSVLSPSANQGPAPSSTPSPCVMI